MTAIPPRVILLIDEWVDGQKIDVLLGNLHLTCLRLLSYYAHNTGLEHKKTAVLWGYKFFNSRKNGSLIMQKQHQFLDYTTANFDAFEKELYMKYQSNPSNEIINCKQPGVNLRLTFTELLSDFHWERPELFSPSKKACAKIEDDDLQNLVYMFTSVPDDIGQYFGKTGQISKDDISKTLFPKSLYSKFISQHKIKLLWVDTSENIKKNTCNIDDLKLSLTSLNGSLFHLRQFSLFWMCYISKSSKEFFSDIVNVSSIIDSLIGFKNTFHNQQDLLECKLSLDSETNSPCTLLLSLITRSKRPRSKHKETMQFVKYISRSILDPSVVDLNYHFHYVVCTSQDNNADIALAKQFKDALMEKKALMVSWNPGNDDEQRESVLIPFTTRVGVIVTLKSALNEPEPKYMEVSGSSVNLSAALSKRLTIWEFGSSLVNCVEGWFTSNPSLGMKATNKNIFRKIYKDKILKSQEQEQQSKELINMLKKSLKKDKDESEKVSEKHVIRRAKKQKRDMKGMTWARWRLLAYQQKRAGTKGTTDENGAKSEPNELKTTAVSTAISNEDTAPPLEVKEFRSQEDLSDYLHQEWKTMSDKTSIMHRYMTRFVSTAIQFFTNIDETRCQELGVNFIQSNFFKSIDDIRKEYDGSKDQLLLQYLLHVQLLCECSTAVQHDSNGMLSSFCKRIILLLRSVTFEESPSFVQDHLKNVLLPCYLERNKRLLLSIYEDLMFDAPECLDNPEIDGDEDKKEVESSPLKSIPQFPSSIGEYHSDDFSSVGSCYNERRTIKRIPSVVGENSNKRMITVQPRRSVSTTDRNTTKKKNQKKETSNKLERRRSERISSLFDPSLPLSPNNQPKTPNLKRRHSEICLRKKVPETPEGKQKNDLMWKKQDLNRRISKVDKTMKPIEESPIKSITTSEMRRSSLLTRSYSFTSRTSPRRFYAVRRIPSSGFDTKTESYTAVEGDKVNLSFLNGLPKKIPQSQSPSKIKTILFSNFGDLNEDLDTTSDTNDLIEKQDYSKSNNPEESNKSIESKEITKSTSRKRTRRNIFDAPASSDNESLSFDSSDLIKRRFSEELPSRCSKKPRIFQKSSSSYETSDLLKASSHGSYEQQSSTNPDHNGESADKRFYISSTEEPCSENTMDWMHEIEQEDIEQIHQKQQQEYTNSNSDNSNIDSFRKLTKTPAGENENCLSPCVRRTLDNSPLSSLKQSPNIVRTANESIKVSPLFSAASLELLENAPIISPISNSSKKSRNRRVLNTEYV